MYDEEEEITITKIQIPKYKILFSDIEVERKDQNSNDNILSLNDRSERSEKNLKKEDKNLIEKILECIDLFNL